MRQTPRIALLVSVALTVLVYWPGLNGPFVLDDEANLAPLNDWLSGHVGATSVIFGNDSGLLGRPISMASFVANVVLLGPGSWGLKLGNLLVHLINGGLVFALFGRLTQLNALTRNANRSSMWPAWVGASIWLLHPFLASTVLYVVQRMAMLSASLTLLTMLAYLYGRTALNEGKRTIAYALLAFAAPLCALLAALSKENGILAPALCAVLELIIFCPPHGQRRDWRSSIYILAALALPVLAIAIATATQLPFVVGGYIGRPFTLTERLLTETRVLWDYIANLLVPGGAHLGFYHDDFAVSHGLFDPTTTVFAIAGWMTIVAIAWRVREAIPGFVIGLGIFLVGQILESTVFPLLLYFEHRNYLPSVGVIWSIVSIFAYCNDGIRLKLRYRTAFCFAVACMFILILAAGTFVRAQTWTSQRAIITEAALMHPNSRGARFDSIVLSLAMHPPAISQARAGADWLRHSTDFNTRRVGTVERVLTDCTESHAVSNALVREMFDGPQGPYEQDLVRAFEFLSDDIAQNPCGGLSPGQLADGLTEMLNRWELSPKQGRDWRLRFRAANLYMAADRNGDAIEQAKLAYAHGSAPTNTAIMIAGLLLYCGDASGAAEILDAVEPKLRSTDKLAKEIVLDDRKKIRAAEQARIRSVDIDD